ncbi:hypothetical protein FB45DRAFT_718114, partial [Roridomyces roridus]
YRLRAPIENEDSDEEVEGVAGLLKEAQIGISWETLIKLSPRLRKKMKGLLTKSRVPIKDALEVLELIEQDPDQNDETPAREVVDTLMDGVPDGMIDARQLPYQTQIEALAEADGLVPKGALVVTDPVLQYLTSVPASGTLKRVFLNE